MHTFHQRLGAGLTIAALMTAMTSMTGCSRTNPTETRIAEERDMREAVFRYEFAHNTSALQANAQVLCLKSATYRPPNTYAPGDPDDALMARFAGHRPMVRKTSECRQETDGVYDKESGAQGIQFGTYEISRRNDDEATVTGGFYESSTSWSSHYYVVRKSDGRWTVVEDKKREFTRPVVNQARP